MRPFRGNAANWTVWAMEAGAQGMPTNDKILYYIFNRQNPRVRGGSGYYYYDIDGNQYVDMTSGAHNCVLGHTMPERIAHVIREQAGRLNYAAMAHFQNDSADRLVDTLLALMPDYAAIGLFQSGVDAVEAALRCAQQVASTRHSPARKKIIGRRGSFHGLTWAARAIGGWLGLEAHDAPNFLHIEPQDCLDCPFGMSYPSCELKCASVLQELIEKEGPETIAAFFAVPSRMGGPVPSEYWRQIRDTCDRYGVLLVLDEVLEGMWKTGPSVALKHWNVVPDVLATGKVLGAGFVPIFATLVTESVRDTLAQRHAFTGGHTYSGHILSCEVALAVLDEIEDRRLSSIGVESVSHRLRALLKRVCEQYEGLRMGARGTVARLQIPCIVPPDHRSFYLEVQANLFKSGLISWIAIHPSYVEVHFGPPYIADEEYFQQLEVRLIHFIRTLPLGSASAGIQHPSGTGTHVRF